MFHMNTNNYARLIDKFMYAQMKAETLYKICMLENTLAIRVSSN
jgi:hypothetical protein